jgi:hypothetical protein
MKRANNKDRLGDLPDSLLLVILSFLDAKYAVQTCILSKRWKNLWKHLPTLALSSSSFTNNKCFIRFVLRILSLRRTSSITLHTLDFQSHGYCGSFLIRMVVKYAVSCNVHRLRIEINATRHIQRFPPCFFSCHTLTSLELYVDHHISFRAQFPNSLHLPALTTLSLEYFVFHDGGNGCAEPFSELSKLNTLVIRNCKVLDAQNLYISSATLANFTIEMDPNDYSKVELDTPSLCSFDFTGIPVQKLCGSKCNLSSLKDASINVPMGLAIPSYTPLVLLGWLVELTNIESLTVPSSTLQVS